VIGLLRLAVDWLYGKGSEYRRVMSDKGTAYVSKAFAKACSILGLRHNRTSPYTPRTNVKTEEFIQTHCKEWAYATDFHNLEEWKGWLPLCTGFCNRLMKDSGLSWRLHLMRLSGLLG